MKNFLDRIYGEWRGVQLLVGQIRADVVAMGRMLDCSMRLYCACRPFMRCSVCNEQWITQCQYDEDLDLMLCSRCREEMLASRSSGYVN